MNSPDETYSLDVTSYELQMGQWVHSFQIVHNPTGDVVFSLEQTLWSIQGPSYEGNVLSATLRLYPGERDPLPVAFHLDERKAVVEGREIALDAFENELRGR